jgi:PAS domain S-box-containing protein
MPFPADGEMARRVRRQDWTTSPLGPTEEWPASLLSATDIVLSSGFPMILIWGRDLIVAAYNDAYLPLLGDKPEALGRGFLDVWSEARDTIGPEIEEVLKGRTVWRKEAIFILHRSEGMPEQAWFDYQFSPVHDEAGAVAGVLNVGVEVTDRKRAEQELTSTEARFRQFGAASPDALWIRDAGTLEWEYLSPSFDRIYGISREDALASRSIDFLMSLILPEDRDATRAAIGELHDGDRSYAYRIRRPSDGEIRWLRTTGFPLPDPSGTVQRLGGITQDITEEKRAADRQAVLVAELQHRTRNLLGVVRAMASRTLKTSASLEDFGDRFGARLAALARANGLLSRLGEGERVSFDELLRTELLGHGLIDGEIHSDQVSLSGPPGIPLPSATVQTVGLAVHELLTNATKHGALGTPDGHLSIEWTLEDGAVPHLAVEWRESGVRVSRPADAPHRESGYGRQLIERALPHQLGAETRYELEPDGLRCVIRLPVPQRDRNDADHA